MRKAAHHLCFQTVLFLKRSQLRASIIAEKSNRSISCICATAADDDKFTQFIHIRYPGRSRPSTKPRCRIMSCTRLKWSISSCTSMVISCTKSDRFGFCTMSVIALLAALSSQKAWSVKSSLDIKLSTTFLTQSGSVGNCSLRIVFSLTEQR